MPEMPGGEPGVRGARGLSPPFALSIRARLTLLIGSVTALVLALGLPLMLAGQIRLMRQQLAHHALLQARLLGESCVVPLAFENPSDAQEFLATVRTLPEAEGAAIFTTREDLFAVVGDTGAWRPGPDSQITESVRFDDRHVIATVPIKTMDRRLGVCLFRASTAHLDALIVRAERLYLSLAVVMGLLSLALANLLQRSLTRPILDLASKAHDVAQKGDYATPIGHSRRDEIGVLYDEFNRMLGTIQRKEEALTRSEARYRRLIETTSQGFWQLDAAGRTVDCNRAMLDMLGVSLGDVVGKSPLAFIHEESLEAAEQVLLHREEREQRTFDLAFRKVDGTPVQVHCSATNLRGADGSFQGSFAMVTDQSERLRAHQLSLERDAAKAATRAKSEFLANMSHEIRTPMNAIMGFSALGMKLDLDPKPHDYFHKIATSSRLLLGIINDILDFSKVEAGHLELERVPFRLSQVTEHLRDLFAQSAADKGLELKVTIREGTPEHLVGDPLRLGQVLINLVSNALKFTSSGRISVDLRQEPPGRGPARLRVSVADTGIGMSRAQMDRLFQPFTQADTSTARRFGGTGLGLAICRRLVELMGGTLALASEPGKGSTFTFTALLTLASPEQVAQIPPPSGGHAAFSPSAVLAGLRILLVEDNAINQEVARELLEGWGVALRIASSGRDALRLLDSETFDLVLMDVQMPDMDGFETTARIRQMAAHEGLPILAMTANALEQDRLACLEAGMNDFVPKPIEPQELLAALLRWGKAFATPPSGAAPCAPKEAILWDRASALRRLGGNEDLLERLLEAFRREDLGDLRAALKAGDLALAGRLAHTLKGVAGNLGARRVQEEAALLERSLREGPASREALPRLEAALTETFAALEGAP